MNAAKSIVFVGSKAVVGYSEKCICGVYSKESTGCRKYIHMRCSVVWVNYN